MTGCPLKVSACLYVTGTLREVSIHVHVAETMTACPLGRGVHLWEVKNVMFVCLWDQTECQLQRGIHSY